MDISQKYIFEQKKLHNYSYHIFMLIHLDRYACNTLCLYIILHLHNASHSKCYYIFSVDKMHVNIETALKDITLHTEQV